MILKEETIDKYVGDNIVVDTFVLDSNFSSSFDYHTKDISKYDTEQVVDIHPDSREYVEKEEHQDSKKKFHSHSIFYKYNYDLEKKDPDMCDLEESSH